MGLVGRESKQRRSFRLLAARVSHHLPQGEDAFETVRADKPNAASKLVTRQGAHGRRLDQAAALRTHFYFGGVLAHRQTPTLLPELFISGYLIPFPRSVSLAGRGNGPRHRPVEHRTMPRNHAYSSLDQAHRHHRLRHLDEAGDVGTDDIVARRTELLRRFVGRLVDAGHDFVELLLRILESP